MAAEEWVGRVIDQRYVVESGLGAGGMGVVLRAKHRFTGQTVALKVLKPELSNDAAIQARFLAEAQAPNAIGHPGIVRVHDAGRDPSGFLYLVMELLEGRSLRVPMVRSQLGPLDASRIMLELLDALATAHARGFVHRDLKPDNVFLVAPHDTVKLLDFGIAKVLDVALARVRTATGITMGTPAYMSPEQLNDAASVDARADLWACGVIVYEMLCGRLPFRGERPEHLLVAIATQNHDPIRAYLPQAPAELEAFFTRALSRDPRMRFGAAAEMGHALTQLPLHKLQPAAAATALGPQMTPPASYAASSTGYASVAAAATPLPAPQHATPLPQHAPPHAAHGSPHAAPPGSHAPAHSPQHADGSTHAPAHSPQHADGSAHAHAHAPQHAMHGSPHEAPHASQHAAPHGAHAAHASLQEAPHGSRHAAHGSQHAAPPPVTAAPRTRASTTPPKSKGSPATLIVGLAAAAAVIVLVVLLVTKKSDTDTTAKTGSGSGSGSGSAIVAEAPAGSSAGPASPSGSGSGVSPGTGIATGPFVPGPNDVGNGILKQRLERIAAGSGSAAGTKPSTPRTTTPPTTTTRPTTSPTTSTTTPATSPPVASTTEPPPSGAKVFTCDEGCRGAARCGLAASHAACLAECAAKPAAKQCWDLAAANNCTAAAHCGIAATCGSAARGAASCRDAFFCQLACGALGGDSDCSCRCTTSVQPSLATLLFRVDACVVGCGADNDECLKNKCRKVLESCVGMTIEEMEAMGDGGT